MRGQGALQLRDGSLDPSRHEEDFAQPSLRAGGLGPLVGGLEDRDRLLEQWLGLVHPAAHDCELSGAGQRTAALDAVVAQPRRSLECPLRLEGGCERRGSIGRTCEPAARLGPHRVGIGSVRVGLVRVEVVHGDHLGDLVRIDPGLRGEEEGNRQVACPAVAPGDRLVRDPLHERLQEAELSALGRERVGLDGEQLLPHQARDELLDLVRRRARRALPDRES